MKGFSGFKLSYSQSFPVSGLRLFKSDNGILSENKFMISGFFSSNASTNGVFPLLSFVLKLNDASSFKNSTILTWFSATAYLSL